MLEQNHLYNTRAVTYLLKLLSALGFKVSSVRDLIDNRLFLEQEIVGFFHNWNWFCDHKTLFTGRKGGFLCLPLESAAVVFK